MQDEQPFRISVSQNTLDGLAQKLAIATLPAPAPATYTDALDSEDWTYGVPRPTLERLLIHWRTQFLPRWHEHQAVLNALPQFTRSIEVDGHGVFTAHYVHKQSTHNPKGAIPLLFLHGWPGHFNEVSKLLPFLTTPPANAGYPSFHVVAPSLPGFGFSSAPTKTGFAMAQYAEFAHKLMLSLGYTEYIVQGGDWGSFIAYRLAYLYGPKYVKAWHTNFPAGRRPTLTRNPLLYLQHAVTPYSAKEKKALRMMQWFRSEGQGYFAIQSTMPQTLSYALADSPVGLLAWIYEKLVKWTDGYEWGDDEVLTWISIYLFSVSGPETSVRIYYETVHQGNFDEFSKLWSPIPLGLSFFPHELVGGPRTWARTMGNVVFESEHNKGGHFAAYEQPQALVDDLRAMFGKGGKAFGVVKGKDGY
ncbi:hypothetical protein EW026_g8256 [Hermanssonia centrifuga]|uniref:Epoxide hydrolase N-terminal domain-containing protein n=1 Tax=Hermanssonia centrifuga TaxID=98765 RepID=A0A4S4K6J8_9APHY|nr:hypothetical protein EW026_g8256 [Hermanssonia centrifuga]